MPKLDSHLKLVNELGNSFHKLSTTAVIFWSIVLVDQQALDLRKSFSYRQPEIVQAVCDEVAGNTRLGEVQIEFIILR